MQIKTLINWPHIMRIKAGPREPRVYVAMAASLLRYRVVIRLETGKVGPAIEPPGVICG